MAIDKKNGFFKPFSKCNDDNRNRYFSSIFWWIGENIIIKMKFTENFIAFQSEKLLIKVEMETIKY